MLFSDDMFDVKREVIVFLLQLAIFTTVTRAMSDESLYGCVYQAVRD